MERTLVLIKPDAMVKRLAGNIISDLYNSELKMVGLKLVNVQRELAEKHYSDHTEKPFFEDLISHMTGKLHKNENVIAICYEGEGAIQKIRDMIGKTNPDECEPHHIRGKYGKVHTKTNCFESVVHASDTPEAAKKEIELWFDEDELI